MKKGMGIIERIVKWIKEKKIFVRERKSNTQRALGMLLYHAGLSYNKTAIFVNASYEAVRKWYRKGRKLFEQTLEAKKRKRIAIDEKEIRINGMKIFIWAAVDLEDEKVIAVYVSMIKPEEGKVYFMDREIFSISSDRTIIIGGITIGVKTNGERVEFYIDGKLKYNDNEQPYSWLWNEFAIGNHEIKVKAYDERNEAMDEISVLIYNL